MIQGRIKFRFSSVPMRSTGKTVAELRDHRQHRGGPD